MLYSLDQYSDEQKLQLVEVCPVRVFEVDEAARAVVVARMQDCIFCRECVQLLEDFRKFPEEKLGKYIYA